MHAEVNDRRAAFELLAQYDPVPHVAANLGEVWMTIHSRQYLGPEPVCVENTNGVAAIKEFRHQDGADVTCAPVTSTTCFSRSLMDVFPNDAHLSLGGTRTFAPIAKDRFGFFL